MSSPPDPIDVTKYVQAVIDEHAAEFDSVETISVSPDAVVERGRRDWSKPLILVKARRPELLKEKLPATLGGIPVRVIAATSEEQALHYRPALKSGRMDPAEQATAWRIGGEAETAVDYSKLTYEPLKPTRLVSGEPRPMAIVFHVSPDRGWPVLKEFLAPAATWQVAMYDFTAPHIIEGLKSAMGEEAILSLCLGPHESLGDGTKRFDISEVTTVAEFQEMWGKDDRFNFAWASVGSRRQWPRAYHIKVAVRDGEAMWLSSGNWQSSNQPEADYAEDVTPSASTGREMNKHNRDWHVMVEDRELSAIYADYIEKDVTSSQLDEGDVEAVTRGVVAGEPSDLFLASFAVPIRLEDGVSEAARLPKRAFQELRLPRDENKLRAVQPILTPDNYAEMVMPLLEQASQRLWFQNQSLGINKFPSKGYREMLNVLKEKSWELDDCRIIFRDIMRVKTKEALKVLELDGFNMSKVRVMNNCHTKGILVDSRWTLIGSHNWTNEGTTYNRDASLLFDDPEITAYFEEIVDHDWEHLAFSLPVDLGGAEAVIRLPGDPHGELEDAVEEDLPSRLDPLFT